MESVSQNALKVVVVEASGRPSVTREDTVEASAKQNQSAGRAETAADELGFCTVDRSKPRQLVVVDWFFLSYPTRRRLI